MQCSVKIPLLLQKSKAKNNAKRHHYLVNLQFELKMQYLPNPNSKFKKSLKIDNSGNYMFCYYSFSGEILQPVSRILFSQLTPDGLRSVPCVAQPMCSPLLHMGDP